MITVKIEGAAEIQKALDLLPKRIQGKIMLAALRAGGTVIRKDAQSRVPVRHEPGAKPLRKGGAKGRLPGFLKASITIRRKRGEGDSLEVGASKRAFYGKFLEFGTRHQAARPWLRPAFDESAGKALQAIGRKLGDLIEKLATTGSLGRRFKK